MVDHLPLESVWYPIARVAEELTLPVEVVRIGAVTDLNLDVYDPERDAVTARGWQQILEHLRA